MNTHLVLGKLGEELAAEMLAAEGYELLCRNYSCACGEIDIIARKRGTISFVEVKTRAGLDCGRPAEAVTPAKQRRIKNAAQYFLQTCRWYYTEVDFQVIEVLVNQILNAEF